MQVLIVDDDSLIREILTILLQMEEDIEVCGTATNGEEAFQFCQDIQPDIILMDIRMPILDGVEGTKKIKACFPQIPIVILTTFQDDEYIREALHHGAAGYILKNQSSDSIINTLRAVLRGNAVFQQDVVQRLNNMLQARPQKSLADWGLTPRESELLALVGDGKSNKEIAGELFLSEGTIRNYITNLLEKLELRDRTQLAIFYLKNIQY